MQEDVAVPAGTQSRWGSWRGADPTIAAAELGGPPGGSQDPDEAAQGLCHLHADGRDGVLQEQVQSWKEQSTDMPGGAAGPQPPTTPSRILALLHRTRKEKLQSQGCWAPPSAPSHAPGGEQAP